MNAATADEKNFFAFSSTLFRNSRLDRGSLAFYRIKAVTRSREEKRIMSKMRDTCALVAQSRM